MGYTAVGANREATYTVNYPNIKKSKPETAAPAKVA